MTELKHIMYTNQKPRVKIENKRTFHKRENDKNAKIKTKMIEFKILVTIRTIMLF